MKPCSFPGCSALVERRRYCDKHDKLSQRRRRSKDTRASSSKRGYGAQWQKRRLEYLRRNPLCEAPECNSPATDVDHILPKSQGGSDEDANLQALCKSCHSKKTKREMFEHNRDVVVVSGAPGSGKTTYVRSKYRSGDIIIDFDSLFSALSWQPLHTKPKSLLPFVSEVFDAVVRIVEEQRDKLPRKTYVIGTLAKRLSREKLCNRLKAQSIVMDVSMAECKKRIRACPYRGGRSELFFKIITKYYADFEASEQDRRIKPRYEPRGASNT